MIIVEKNPGQKIDYEVNKTKLTFDDDLTLNLAKREEDYAVHIDVCFDEDGALCIGAAAGRSYVARSTSRPASTRKCLLRRRRRPPARRQTMQTVAIPRSRPPPRSRCRLTWTP